MKLSQLRKMAVDTIERASAGDDTAEPEFRAWCLKHAGDVAHALAADALATAERIEAYTGESFAQIILKTCDARRDHVRERDTECSDRNIALAAARVVESANVCAGGWVLNSAALVALAKLLRGGERCLGFRIGDLVIHVRAKVIRSFAAVRHPRDWTAVLDVDAGHLCIVAPGAGVRPCELRASNRDATYTAGFHAYAVFPDCTAVDLGETVRDVAAGAMPRALESNTRVWQEAS